LDDLEFLPLNSLRLKHMELSISVDRRVQERYSDWLSGLGKSLQEIWPNFLRIASEEGIFDVLGIDYGKHQGYIELTWTGNQSIHELNREYRQKDAATDVLSFTLLADSDTLEMWLSLPQFQLGSIFISLDWAVEHYREMPFSDNALAASRPASLRLDEPLPVLEETLWCYIMERVIHGFLHLHGQHHDTMLEFDRVVRIQKKVLDATLNLSSAFTPVI